MNKKILLNQKIISLFAILLSCFMVLTPVSANDTTVKDIDYGKEELFAFGVGAFEKESYVAEKNMTRAEFAGFVAKLLGGDAASGSDWRKDVFGADDKDMRIEAEISLFEDLDQTHEHYNAIKTVCAYGYMHGISDNKFAPDYMITMREAVKIFMDMMNYGDRAMALGGYPEGYLKMAQQTHILRSNSSKKLTEPLTQKEAVNLLYQAIDVPVLQLQSVSEGESSYYADKGKTFLTEILKLERVKGRVVDNGVTTFVGDSKVGDKKVQVDNKVLLASERVDSIRSYIGREVEAFYSIDNDSENELISYALLDTDDVLTLEKKDIYSVTRRGSRLEVSYEKGTKSISVKDPLIYNGKLLKSYTEELFDFDTGSITLIGRDGAYDLMVVRAYEFLCIDNIDSAQVVYGRGKGGASAFRLLDLSGKNTDFMSLKDENGKHISVSELTSGMVLNVLKSADKKAIEVVATNHVVSEFIIKSIENDGKNSIISDGETGYEALSLSAYHNAVKLENGESYSLYLNHEGQVVWVEKADTALSTKQVGIIMAADKTEKSALSDACSVMLYTTEGDGKIYSFADKISVNGARKEKAVKVVDQINAKSGEPILYTVNSAGEVSSVIWAEDFGGTDVERGWYRINPKAELHYNETTGEYSGSDGDGSGHRYNWYMYQTQGKHFSNWIYMIPNETKVFTVPGSGADKTDAKQYSLNKMSFTDYAYYALDGYSTEKDAIEADVLVIKQAMKGSGSVSKKRAFLIESISNAYDAASDETMIRLNGYAFDYDKMTAVKTYLNLSDEVIMVDEKEIGTELEPDLDPTLHGPRNYKELEPGDIVAYGTDSAGTANVLRILYDYDGGKADFDYKTDIGKGYTSAGRMTMGNAGYAKMVRGNSLQISLPRPGSAEDVGMWANTDDFRKNNPLYTNETATASQINMQDYFPYRNYRLSADKAIVIVTAHSSGDLRMSLGTMADITTYEDTVSADMADKAVVITLRYGDNFGTVIYKTAN